MNEWQKPETAPYDKYVLVYVNAPWSHTLDDPKRVVAMRRRYSEHDCRAGSDYWDTFGALQLGAATVTAWQALPHPPDSVATMRA